MTGAAPSSKPLPAREVGPDAGGFLSRCQAALGVKIEPIVGMEHGRLVAAEALIGDSRAMGFDSPVGLLDAAEAVGVLSELELHLASLAIRDYVSGGIDRPRFLFLNMDGRLLHRWQGHRDGLLWLVEAAGLSPSEVCIELSEAHQPLPEKAFAAAVAGLREPGFRIAIDDFGTGISGLQMLYQANPDFLKIDRFFVSAMPDDPRKRLLVTAIVKLAHTLGARVIAEGIETQAELDACQDAGCDLLQGYYLQGPSARFEDLQDSYTLNRQDRATRHRQEKIGALLARVDPLPEDAPLETLLSRLVTGETTELWPVVDAAGLLRGAVKDADARTLILGQYGQAHQMTRPLGVTMRHLTRPVPTLNIRMPLAEGVDRIASEARHGVIATDGDTYLGVLSAFDLLQLANDIRLTEATRRNPLTGLPGNEAIADEVERLVAAEDRERFLAYIDIRNFKPFNDAYGFESGDRAIQLLADILSALRDGLAIFVGHVGGDDFFLGASGTAAAPAARAMLEIPARFARAASSLFSPEDRARGGYDAIDRAGRPATLPLLGCTAVGLRIAADTAAADLSDITRTLADQKAAARQAGKDALVHRLP